MSQSPYSQLIAVKRWADRGLCEVVGRNLDGFSDLDATILLRIFDHIHVVDRIFQHHLLGQAHPYQAARSETLPGFEALAAGMREVGDWYGAYVESLSPDDLDRHVDFTFTSGKPARMRRGEILLHVCTHGTYHRGNVGAVLQLRGLSPGRDSITDYLEEAQGSAAAA
ncbi:MAG: hypothetical protein C0481_12575 [Phenylobacterium sp.]|uniref:DinB family protein n=1 Tax=Phenylobacterium sp. TaxID=1871053 RepID=UPI0025DB2D77|nr:DinB family protein [Phenylobacterium sp.]MBA4012695.1 hypothetical protein [Phenylobacterium sp.]